MRNTQLKPGHNIQIAFESEYIVGTLISSERSDQLTLIPVLDKLEENLDKKFFIIVDDAGYESQENYTFIEQNNQTSFLKTPNYETMKKSSFKRDISKRENMRYDEKLNDYTCYNNRKLKPVVN